MLECQDDGLFIRWFEHHQSPGSRSALAIAILSEPTPTQINLATEPNASNESVACENLARDDEAASQVSWADLSSLASLVLRNELLEGAFSAELGKTHRRVLYNFAYGLSHELNNPLASISTRAGVLLSSAESIEQAELLQAIIDNAMRGCEMLGDLMLVARPPKIARQKCSSKVLISQLLEKSDRWVRMKNVELTVAQAIDVQLCIDQTAMIEAMWCLLRNSLEAMSDGGKVVIENDSIENECGTVWCCRLIDNGPGLTDAALESAFDPYFSGREAGRGLGVGLYKARRIIELHDGELLIENVPKGGCQCTIQLPLSKDL